MAEAEEVTPSTTMYDQLDKLIQNYIRQIWNEQGMLEEGDYVASWALVINHGNLDRAGGMAGDYSVETMPQKNPPHATKGLFREGIDWVLEAQERELDDDDI